MFWFRMAQLEFAQALAQLPQGWPRTGWQQWAAYRVGLYHTVAQSTWDGRHLHGGLAVAVSLAACGRSDEAVAVVQRLVKRHGQGPYRAQLADALAPFMPAQALAVLDNAAGPVTLRAALLLRTGEREQAAQLLRTALAASGKLSPQLHLLAANAFGGGPAAGLAQMNAFLVGYGLPAVALIDNALPLNVVNLKPAQQLAQVHGPLVSVLMTAFNSAERIGPAIAGLLGQTWQDLEVVVVDDASTDATGDVVRALAAQDSRVKYLRLPCNAGTYAAKTIGLAHARGEFLTCHDSDDWSHPQRIERQMAPLLASKELVATTSQWVRLQDDGVFYARPVHPLPRLNPSSPLFRRHLVVQHTGLWDAARTGADSEFHSRLRLVFGRRGMRRLVMPLAFGAHRADSLMTATDTGFSAEGMSPQRLAYWEAWTHWHISELAAGRKPRMPSMQALGERAFAAPDGVAVAPGALAACVAELGQATYAA